LDDRAVIAELARRAVARVEVEAQVARIKAELFREQVDFVEDPATEKGALCTRRAGKTSMWTRYSTIESLLHPRSIIRIWGVNRLRAKQLLWDEFKWLIARHGIKLAKDPNETELTIRFANDSEIRLLGADKDKEAQKKRGDKTRMEVVLEAQLFGPYLRKLVEEVAQPCLFDLKGTFCLEGTPGPVCSGYWWEVSGRNDFERRWTSPGDKDGLGAGWSMHRWSVLDNPFLPDARADLAKTKKRRRWTDDNPTYVREWLGRWVNDLGALYYKFDPLRNEYTVSDKVRPWGPGWEHVLGWDLGFRDDMALVVWGYHPKFPELYEAFSWKKPGALSPEIVGVIEKLERQGIDGTPFNIIARVADTGGGGRMYVEEVVNRYGMQFEAAKKTDKYEHVRLFNDDLLGGFIKLQSGSMYAQEIATLPRDLDVDPEKPEEAPAEDPRFPNHCCDAGLYAYRRAWHYLHREEVAKPVPGTEPWFKQEVQRMEAAAISKAQKRQEDWVFAFPEDSDDSDLFGEGPDFGLD
jgi:hypothetical protein